ncbi:MAG: SUMF1/EgtB/PvdO family nonheme iron enzyme [Nitrospirae bacterium]|nr:SUMF1/EgtB/PvdO family nonheme iron enzyme [Nitrospirota bacterium]
MFLEDLLKEKNSALYNEYTAIRDWVLEMWSQGQALTFFMEHGPEHSRKVLSYLSAMLERPLEKNKDILSDIELYLLCVSAWLHDVGMQVEFKDRTFKPYPPQFDYNEQLGIRKTHAQKSEEIINALKDHAPFYNRQYYICSDEYNKVIGLICSAHSGKNKTEIEKRLLNEVPSDTRNNLKIIPIIGLLQFADAVHMSKERVVGKGIEKLYLSGDYPGDINNSLKKQYFNCLYIDELLIGVDVLRGGGYLVKVKLSCSRSANDKPSRVEQQLEIYWKRLAGYREDSISMIREGLKDWNYSPDIEWRNPVIEKKPLPEDISLYQDMASLDRFEIDDIIRIYADRALSGLQKEFKAYLTKDIREDVRAKHADEFGYLLNDLSLVDLQKRELMRDGEKANPYEFDKIIADPSPIRIFYGDAGVGKTIFFKNLEIKLLENMKTEKDGLKLPLYVFIPYLSENLNDILKERIAPFINDVVQDIEGTIEKMRHDNRFIFLFDSFDQADKDSLDNFKKLVGMSHSLPRDAVYYISTRPNNIGTLLSELKQVFNPLPEIIRIEPFNEGLLKDYLGSSHQDIKPLLDKYPNLKQVVSIPMFAMLIKGLHLSDKKGIKDIKTKSDIYKKLLSGFKQSERQRKEIKGIDFDELEILIEELSTYLLEQGGKQVVKGKMIKNFIRTKYGELSMNYLEALKNSQFFEFCKGIFDAEHKDFWDDAEIKYHHLSFQEYLAGKYLANTYLEKGYEIVKESILIMTEKNNEFLSVVSDFFSETVMRESADLKTEIKKCHEIMENESNPWALTYFLELRDMLGSEGRGKEELERIFEEENKRLRLEETNNNMIHIPQSRFLRGSYEYKREMPVRWIEIDEYYISKYTVTNEEFLEFLKDHKKIKNTEGKDLIILQWSKIEKYGKSFEINDEYRNYPVTGTTWYGAEAYCEWRSKKEKTEYRLPTEAEWEKAAKGEMSRIYPWGNEFNKEKTGTWPIKITLLHDKWKSPYGCHMAGNVAEWCKDSYNEDFYKDSDLNNPICKKDVHGRRVTRGGYWGGFGSIDRCTNRAWIDLSYHLDMCSFRCARTKK